MNNNNLRYCYRAYDSRDSIFCCFAFNCELCADVINCKDCYALINGLNCEGCSDSAFLYDCKGCSYCFMCSNLRHASYCIRNQAYTKSEYEEYMRSIDRTVRSQYERLQREWCTMIDESTFHRGRMVTQCEEASGDYLGNCRRVEDCFFSYDIHDCAHCVRGSDGLSFAVDCVAFDLSIERLYSSVDVTGPAYEIRNCAHIVRGRYLEYCNFCFDCEHCFGCSGLVGAKYCIFNAQYSPLQYEKEVKKIVRTLKEQGVYEDFFPAYFAATSFEQSWSGFYLPLAESQQRSYGFRCESILAREQTSERGAHTIPDLLHPQNQKEAIGVYWDQVFGRPFSISTHDIAFCKRLEIPLFDSHYIRRLQTHARRMPFFGEVVKVQCSQCKSPLDTSCRGAAASKLLCDLCYLNQL